MDIYIEDLSLLDEPRSGRLHGTKLGHGHRLPAATDPPRLRSRC